MYSEIINNFFVVEWCYKLCLISWIIRVMVCNKNGIVLSYSLV